MKTEVHLIDAFTTIPNQGNRAGVVLDADDLTPTDMQAIAKQVNVSETAFVLQSSSPDYDLEVRYFTPTKEVPICGHATIATHFLRATLAQLPAMTLRVKTGAGILPVDISATDGRYTIIMTQGPFQIDPPLSIRMATRIREALGLSTDDCEPTFPIQIVSTGHSKVMVPLTSRSRLNELTPNFDQLAQISPDINCFGYYVFTLDSPTPGTVLSGRMFAPAIGILEDPVTGNANGPAGGYLYHHGRLRELEKDGLIVYRALQGEAMGKPGIVEVRIHLDNHDITNVQIAGAGVMAGTIRIA